MDASERGLCSLMVLSTSSSFSDMKPKGSLAEILRSLPGHLARKLRFPYLPLRSLSARAATIDCTCKEREGLDRIVEGTVLLNVDKFLFLSGLRSTR